MIYTDIWLYTGMSSIAIYVMHSGKWDDANCYVDYVIEGVIFWENASFTQIYNIFATQLFGDVIV